MSRKKTVLTLLLALNLFSCGNYASKVDLTKGTSITRPQLFEYSQDTINDGKRFSFTGYFYLKRDIQLDRNKTVNLGIYTQSNGKGTLIYPVMLDFGKDPNLFYAPEAFTVDKLNVYDNAGKPLTYQDKIQVSFTLDLLTDRARKNMIYFTKDTSGFPIKQEVYAFPFVLKNIRIDKSL